MRVSNVVQAIDLHAGGEHGRVIVGGVLDVPGATMVEKMAHLRDHADELRLRLLQEPRGYPAMCANVILPPTLPGADAGFVIMEPVEYPAMSGTNTICVTTVLLETGMLPSHEGINELTLEAPAGLIRVRAEVHDGKVVAVTFRNVPAFAVHLDAPVEVPTLGTVPVDVAWGGMWYVIADAEPLGLRLTPDEGRDIVRLTELGRHDSQELADVLISPDVRGFGLVETKNAARIADTLGEIGTMPLGPVASGSRTGLHVWLIVAGIIVAFLLLARGCRWLV